MKFKPPSAQTVLFGGRFDPPHLGHRKAVRDLSQLAQVQKIIILASAIPPHKPARAPIQNRIEMAQLNFQAQSSDPYYPTQGREKHIEFCFNELERSIKNPQRPNYSFDTIQELNLVYPELTFVIGMDQISEFHKWYRFPELLWQCHWLILERKGVEVDLAHQIISDWESSSLIKKTNTAKLWLVPPKQASGERKILQIIPTNAPFVSSTNVRKEIALSGSPPVDALLPEVWEYLKTHKLYGIK